MIDYDDLLNRLPKRIALIPLSMENDLEEHYRTEDNTRIVEIHAHSPSPAAFEELEAYDSAFVVLRATPGMREALLASGKEFVLAGWTAATAPERYKDEMIEWMSTQSKLASKVFVSYPQPLGVALSALAGYKAV